MATAKKAAAKKAPAKKSSTRSSSSTPDAIALLKADHREVKQLFEEYKDLVHAEAEDEEKKAIAERICGLLTVHATIEEEIFYPATRESLDEEDLVDEATVEHASAKDLIAQIQSMEPSDDLYDAKVTVLGEYIEHHVKEEETEMFPKTRKSDMDLAELGAQLAERKLVLMEEMGLMDEESEVD